MGALCTPLWNYMCLHGATTCAMFHVRVFGLIVVVAFLVVICTFLHGWKRDHVAFFQQWFQTPPAHNATHSPANHSANKSFHHATHNATHNATYHANHSVRGIRHAFYINLEHRKDRREAIEATLQEAQIPYERIEALNPRLPEHRGLLEGCWDRSICPGQVGCQLSHLAALRRAMDSDWDHVAIFEDDFAWQPFVRPDMVQAAIAEAMELVPHWDVIGLSFNVVHETLMDLRVQFAPEQWVGLTRIQDAHTTGAYIARRSVIAQIHKAFSPENCHVRKDYGTAIDTCWKPLQRSGTWLAFEPQPGTQRRSFSDIEQQMVFYGLARR